MDALIEAKMRNDQRTARANKGEEALKKLTDKIAAKKATLQPESSTPPGNHTGEDKSTHGGSHSTDSTMADE